MHKSGEWPQLFNDFTKQKNGKRTRQNVLVIFSMPVN